MNWIASTVIAASSSSSSEGPPPSSPLTTASSSCASVSPLIMSPSSHSCGGGPESTTPAAKTTRPSSSSSSDGRRAAAHDPDRVLLSSYDDGAAAAAAPSQQQQPSHHRDNNNNGSSSVHPTTTRGRSSITGHSSSSSHTIRGRSSGGGGGGRRRGNLPSDRTRKAKETRTFRRTRGLADSDDGDELTCARTTSTLSTSGRSVSIGSSESWTSHRSGNSDGGDPLGRSSTHHHHHRAASEFRAVVMGESGGGRSALPPPHMTPAAAPADATATAHEGEWHVHAFMDATFTLLFQVHQGPAPAYPPTSSLARHLSPANSQILSSEEIGAFVRRLLRVREEEMASEASGLSSNTAHSVHMSSDSNCWNHPLVQCLQSWIDSSGATASGGVGGVLTGAIPSPNDMFTGPVPPSSSAAPTRGMNAQEDDDSTESDEDVSKNQYGSPQVEASSRAGASTTGRRDGTASNSTSVVGRLGRSLRRQVSRAVSASRSRGSSSVPPQQRNRSRSITSRSRRSSAYDVGDAKSAATPRSMSRHGSRRGASILRTPFVTIGNTNSNDTQAATTDEDTVQAVVVDPIHSGTYRKNPHDHRGSRHCSAIPSPPPPPPPRRGRMPSPPSRDPIRIRSVSRRRFHDPDDDGHSRSVVHRAATVITTSTFRSLSRSRPRHDPRTDASSAASPPPAPPERRMSSRRFRSLSRSRRATTSQQRSADGFGRSVVNQDRGDWI